jgi:tetratricopeptide (TPR) repeat protein
MQPLSEALSLAVSHHQAGNFSQAEQLYQQILQGEPHHLNALHLLGLLHLQRGRPHPAVTYLRQALALRPDFVEAHFNLGNTLRALGQLEEAVACYEETLRLQPRHSLAHNNLGNALRQQGHLEQAAACYRRAIDCKPDHAEAHNNLGNVLTELQRPEEALASLHEALRLQPRFAQAHCNLGNALSKLQRLEEAVLCYQQALRLQPDFAEAHYNLGNARHNLGYFQEALSCYAEALRLQPDHAEAHMNRGVTCLLLGDFERGWPEYEWRWRCEDTPAPAVKGTAWDGSPLAGRTILLWSEQGLGDTFQFLRYAPLVKARGGFVIVATRPALSRILACAAGIDRLVPLDEAATIPFDVQAPLLSLPWLLGTTLATVPASVPYLSADPHLVARWRQELAPFRGLKVGIAWQGNPRYPADGQRSIPLAEFEPLARVAGVHLFSLQKGHGSEQLPPLRERFRVIDLGSHLDETTGAFLDTAAVLENLDLLISSDTAVVHLAGALGVPVWVALSFVPEWRWLLHRQDSPWYPTMRLFRQRQRGNWSELFTRLAGELSRFHKPDRPVRSLLVPTTPGELLDRIARLSGRQRIGEPSAELTALQALAERELAASGRLASLAEQLRQVHEAIASTEEEMRRCEAAGVFGTRFVELARSVQRHNDQRAILQRRIDDLFR